MPQTVHIHCGAAHTIATLLEGGQALRFAFAPARGDESLPRPAEAGMRFGAQVRSLAPGFGGAFVDLGGGQAGFLETKGMQLNEGAIVAASVVRPAVGEKLAVLKPLKDQLPADGKGRLDAPVDAVLEVAGQLDPAGEHEIRCDSVEAAAVLRAAGRTIWHDDAPEFGPGIVEGIEESLAPVVALPDCGRILIEETAAGTMIDVDSGAEVAARVRRNDRINVAVLPVILREIIRRSIGGRIIIDFLPPARHESGLALKKAVSDAVKASFDGRLNQFSRDGLADVIAPRREQSLLERLTKPALGPAIVRAGRGYRTEWLAARAFTVLEAGLSANRNRRTVLEVSSEIADLVALQPRWMQRLSERYGARADIQVTEKCREGYCDVRII